MRRVQPLLGPLLADGGDPVGNPPLQALVLPDAVVLPFLLIVPLYPIVRHRLPPLPIPQRRRKPGEIPSSVPRSLGGGSSSAPPSVVHARVVQFRAAARHPWRTIHKGCVAHGRDDDLGGLGELQP